MWCSNPTSGYISKENKSRIATRGKEASSLLPALPFPTRPADAEWLWLGFGSTFFPFGGQCTHIFKGTDLTDCSAWLGPGRTACVKGPGRGGSSMEGRQQRKLNRSSGPGRRSVPGLARALHLLLACQLRIGQYLQICLMISSSGDLKSACKAWNWIWETLGLSGNWDCKLDFPVP